eukprot:12400835-Karenia_brevis.AAC.1
MSSTIAQQGNKRCCCVGAIQHHTSALRRLFLRHCHGQTATKRGCQTQQHQQQKEQDPPPNGRKNEHAVSGNQC